MRFVFVEHPLELPVIGHVRTHEGFNLLVGVPNIGAVNLMAAVGQLERERNTDRAEAPGDKNPHGWITQVSGAVGNTEKLMAYSSMAVAYSGNSAS